MRILLVEDQPEAVKPLVLLLGARGYTVDVASSCTDALNRIAEEGASTWDAILTDLELPDGSGNDVARAVHPHRCVVAVTGHAIDADATGLFTNHLRKPLDFDALIEVLGA